MVLCQTVMIITELLKLLLLAQNLTTKENLKLIECKVLCKHIVFQRTITLKNQILVHKSVVKERNLERKKTKHKQKSL